MEELIMRIMSCALMVTMVPALWSQGANSRPQSCTPSPQVEGLYATEAWKSVSPPELSPSVIVISVSINSAMKLFIRARDNRNFEIVRGSLKRPRGEVIKQLAASHQLPENPYDAGKLLPIEWETTSISPEQFNELHSSFTSALAKLVEDAQSRSRDVLMTGGRISFHNTQYQIDYSNDGYESFEAIVDDVPTNNGHSDPLVAWVHQLLTFNPKTSVIR
ncbi:MAG: hypothetical protein ABR912_02230 [Terracidiphilus sp.]